MATPMRLPVTSSTVFIDGSNNVYNIPPRHRLRRNVKLAVLFKIIQLILALVCIILLSSSAKVNLSSNSLALTYGIFGAYTIIPAFLIVGFFIKEVTPILLVGYNLFGAAMFFLVWMLMIDSSFSLKLELDQLPPTLDVAGIQRDNNKTILCAILCLSNAILYAVDSVLEIVALRDSN